MRTAGADVERLFMAGAHYDPPQVVGCHLSCVLPAGGHVAQHVHVHAGRDDLHGMDLVVHQG
jgi:hypothetical protein